MGIISFIGYGLFCLVIGYLIPLPPKEVEEKLILGNDHEEPN